MPIRDFNRNASSTPTKTANYTASIDDWVIPVDATSGNLTVTLYGDPGDGAVHDVIVYKTDASANTVTVTDSTFSFVLGSQNESVWAQMNASGDWFAAANADYAGEVNQSSAISTANSAGVSSGVRASTADSKAVSGSINTSVAGSGVTSNSVNISTSGSQNTSQSILVSVSDSKAVSNSVVISSLSTTTNSSVASLSSNLSVTTSTANSG